jgi:hypothetical protein
MAQIFGHLTRLCSVHYAEAAFSMSSFAKVVNMTTRLLHQRILVCETGR